MHPKAPRPPRRPFIRHLATSLATAFALALASAPTAPAVASPGEPAHARAGTRLSPRTREAFATFRQMVEDAAEGQRLADAILALSPFRVLLGGAGPDTLFEIADTDWELLGKASQGLQRHARDQLRFFCDAEALAQRTSPADYRFWRALSEQLSTPDARARQQARLAELNDERTRMVARAEAIYAAIDPVLTELGRREDDIVAHHAAGTLTRSHLDAFHVWKAQHVPEIERAMADLNAVKRRVDAIDREREALTRALA